MGHTFCRHIFIVRSMPFNILKSEGEKTWPNLSNPKKWSNSAFATLGIPRICFDWSRANVDYRWILCYLLFPDTRVSKTALWFVSLAYAPNWCLHNFCWDNGFSSRKK